MNQLTIEQVVHGYDNGHHRLAGSTKLDDASAAQMLLMSDLLSTDPPAVDQPYLCAYPLKTAYKYVVARSWAAHEMSRPGCVWTHSLILDYETLASIADLGSLFSFFCRPQQNNLAHYSLKISIPKHSASWMVSAFPYDSREEGVITAIYGSRRIREIILPTSDSQNDQALAAAVWSQMWPRLRRSFFFCTRITGRIDGVDSDVSLLFTPGTSGSRKSEIGMSAHDEEFPFGLHLLAADLLQNGPTPLRKFLSRYAFDVSDQRGAAAPLSEIYYKLSEPHEARKGFRSAVNITKRSFGAPNDCRVLKADLLLGRLSSDDAAGRAFETTLAAFKEVPAVVDANDVCSHLVMLAEEGHTSIAKLIDVALPSGPGSLGDTVLRCIANAIPVGVVVASKCGIAAKVRLALANPKLLSEWMFWPRDSAERLAFVRRVIETTAGLPEILENLAPVINARECEVIIESTGGVGLSGIFRALTSNYNDVRQIQALAPVLVRHRRLLVDALIDSVPLPFAVMVGLAESIDGSQIEHDIPWDVWLRSCQKGNLEGRLGEEFHLISLLFKAGLSAPKGMGHELLKISFDPLYEAASLERLPYDVRTSLEGRLPFIGYLREWDLCGKLRSAILERYVTEEVVSPSLLEVTSNKGALALILADLGQARSGRQLVEQLQIYSEDKVVDPERRAVIDGVLQKLWW